MIIKISWLKMESHNMARSRKVYISSKISVFKDNPLSANVFIFITLLICGKIKIKNSITKKEELSQ